MLNLVHWGHIIFDIRLLDWTFSARLGFFMFDLLYWSDVKSFVFGTMIYSKGLWQLLKQESGNSQKVNYIRNYLCYILCLFYWMSFLLCRPTTGSLERWRALVLVWYYNGWCYPKWIFDIDRHWTTRWITFPLNWIVLILIFFSIDAFVFLEIIQFRSVFLRFETPPYG